MTDLSFISLTPLLAGADPLEHVIDHAIIKIGGWYVLTNHMVMMVVAAAILLLVFPRLTRNYRDGKSVPTGAGNFFEALLVFVRNDIAKPVLGDQTDKYIPYLWTLFFFILTCNLLGLLPLDALQAPFVPEGGHAIYGTATANLAVTAVLAGFSFVLWNVWGIRENGLKAWAHHFLGGAPVYMAPVMVPVELLGMIVKPFALAIRLMANMTAGHVLIAVLTGLLTMLVFDMLGTGGGLIMSIPIVLGATLIMVLELFVACLQAYIFTFLTTLFIGQLVIHEHEGHEHGHEHPKDVAHAQDVGHTDPHHDPQARPVAAG